MRNATLLNEIADHIEKYPESYSQGSWGRFDPDETAFRDARAHDGSIDWHDLGTDDDLWYEIPSCGTTMCVAGHAAELGGWHPTRTRDGRIEWSVVAMEPHVRADNMRLARPVRSVAEELLGLSVSEAHKLFDAEFVCSPDDLRRFADGEDIE